MVNDLLIKNLTEDNITVTSWTYIWKKVGEKTKKQKTKQKKNKNKKQKTWISC